MLRMLFILFALIGLPLLAGQNPETVSKTETTGCKVVKSKEYLDTYFVCGKPGHADVLQIQFGENRGPKIHIFVGRDAWNRYYRSIEHSNCSDFLVPENSKEARRIQQGLRRNLK